MASDRTFRTEPALDAVAHFAVRAGRPGSRGRYRMSDLTTRMNALAITATVHAAVFGLAVYGWQHIGDGAAPHAALTVTVLTPRDEPKRKSQPGRMAPRQAPEPATVEVHPPPRLTVSPVMTVPADPASVPAAPEGGRKDELAQITQIYRQTLLARLERERDYPRALLLAGRDGAGAVAFRIDRSGRLLDAAIQGSTGDKALDRAALRIVRHAAPFPPIPAPLPDELTITLPVTFLIISPGGDAQGTAR